MTELTRRHLVVGTGILALGACSSRQQKPAGEQLPEAAAFNADYSALPNEPFPVPAVDLASLDPKFRRQIVAYSSPEPPGTLIVDTNSFFLYLTMRNNRAYRYGVGLGRQGFSWAGTAVIESKQEWPKWFPPKEMIARQPELAKYSEANGGHPPGLSNPLGARALYLYENGVDTLYRLHGTAEVYSIGNAVSSGCVRLLNQDIIDLYQRVPTGTRVVVIGAGTSTG